MSDLMNVLLIATMFGCGAYSIYTAIKLRSEAYLFPNKFLYPGNCDPADCQDAVGFMSYMIPRLWVLGALCAVGFFLCLNDYIALGLPLWVDLYVTPAFGVAICVWFIIAQNKAAKRFW